MRASRLLSTSRAIPCAGPRVRASSRAACRTTRVRGGAARAVHRMLTNRVSIAAWLATLRRRVGAVRVVLMTALPPPGYRTNLDVPSLAAWRAIQNNTVGSWLTHAGYHTVRGLRLAVACREQAWLRKGGRCTSAGRPQAWLREEAAAVSHPPPLHRRTSGSTSTASRTTCRRGGTATAVSLAS